VNRDPSVALVALALILVVGAVAAVVGALRSDRRRSRGGGPADAGAGSSGGGSWSLVLDASGPRQIQVIKEVRALTGLGLAEAKQLTDRAPSTVLSGVDHAAASAAYRVLANAGATVRITEVAEDARASTGAEPAVGPAGAYAVVVDDAGPKLIQVIKEVRALTGLGLAEAKRLADHTPSTILSGVDHATATAARGRLADAGAVVRVTEA
jgi:ribosomal protein L7/L12